MMFNALTMPTRQDSQAIALLVIIQTDCTRIVNLIFGELPRLELFEGACGETISHDASSFAHTTCNHKAKL